MNNERKLEEISAFCREQKVDATIAKAYRKLSTKEAVRTAKICNLLRFVVDPYAECLINLTLDMRKSEDVSKAKEVIGRYIKEGFKTRLAFVGDYNYAKESYGVVLSFLKAKKVIDVEIVLVVPNGQLVQFAATLNKWIEE